MPFEDTIELTLPDYWPDAIRELALPQQRFSLGEEDLLALASFFPRLRERLGLPGLLDFSDRLLAWAAGQVTQHESGVFFKTSYGMLKENPFAYGANHSVEDFVSCFRWHDTRFARFLASRILDGGEASIIASPWIDIPAWTEFRVFIRNRQIVGVSQYHTSGEYPQIIVNKQRILSAISDLSRPLLANLHLDDVVADICVREYAAGVWTAALIELNPMMVLTDPCLFSWANGGAFDGSFRYIGSR